jgi:flagellar motility protein MotE (MotC chaperone)
MIMLLSVVIILFGVAAGASWYLQMQQTKDAEHPMVAEEKKGKTGGATSKQSVGETAMPKSLIRSTPSPDTERLTQMAASLQAQQETLKAREQQIAMREKQMDIIHEDIKKEQKRLDGIRKKIDEEMAALTEKIEHLEKRASAGLEERKSLDATKRDIEQATVRIEDLEWINLKSQIKTFDKMEPESAAIFITNLVDQGKLDTAAKILAQVQSRQSAAIFAEMIKQDPKLPGQIMERMLAIKSPTIAAPK